MSQEEQNSTIKSESQHVQDDIDELTKLLAEAQRPNVRRSL
jgi:hypothetical protein